MAGDPLRLVGERALLATDASGRCRLLEPTGLCAVHRQLGADALPVSCRLFPRVCLLTPRGVSISLSHYCPTAAGLLFEDAPFGIVAGAAAFPDSGHYEGLDARQAPPPLLRPGVWLGWDGLARWERHVVDVLGRDGSPEDALALLAAQAERARSWSADRGPFLEFLEEALTRTSLEDAATPAEDALWDDVLASIPFPWRPRPTHPPPVVPEGAGLEGPLRRYLAARAFASWAAIQGAGLRTAVRALRSVLAVARRESARAAREAGRPLDAALLKEALRQSDLLILHLASPEAWAGRLSRCETGSIANPT